MLRTAQLPKGMVMNPIVISTIIAATTVIVSIFAANWLNQQHVNKLMEQMDKRIEEQSKRFAEKIDGLRELMNARFDAVEVWLSALEQRVKRLEDVLFKPTLR
jgi:hypothetical protein